MTFRERQAVRDDADPFPNGPVQMRPAPVTSFPAPHQSVAGQTPLLLEQNAALNNMLAEQDLRARIEGCGRRHDRRFAHHLREEIDR